ncbi:hypothetical protein ALMP_39000 [Streptomyces sp. A012304]|nr:hypothetical protein ALMP_39000 [Streptomyces sp. A012304]
MVAWPRRGAPALRGSSGSRRIRIRIPSRRLRLRLADGPDPRTDQVIGTVHGPVEMSFENGRDNAIKLCGDKFESLCTPAHGCLTKIMCAVREAEDGKTARKAPTPGRA